MKQLESYFGAIPFAQKKYFINQVKQKILAKSAETPQHLSEDQNESIYNLAKEFIEFLKDKKEKLEFIDEHNNSRPSKRQKTAKSDHSGFTTETLVQKRTFIENKVENKENSDKVSTKRKMG